MNTDLHTSITAAFRYLDAQGVPIPTDLLLTARAKGIKTSDTTGDLSSINGAYHDAISEALTDYFEGGSLQGDRNQFNRAAVEGFGAAWDLGIADGGGDPKDEDALAWFNARMEQEFTNIQSLFQDAKQLKKEADADFFGWVTMKADSYTRTLASIYNAARMWAQKTQMLTWNLGNTEKHCATCSKLDGNSHRASWYLTRDYIPRKPGAAMDCGGYWCDCSLTDKNGKEVTI